MNSNDRKNIRVAHVTTSHNPRDNRIFRKECRSLSDAGFETFLIAPSEEEFGEYGVRGIRLRKRGRRLVRLIGGPAEAWWKLMGLRPNVAHFHDPELIPVAVLIKLFRPKTIVVYDAHEDFPKQVASKPYLPDWSVAFVVKLARVMMMVARVSCDWFVAATPAIARSYPPDRTAVVQNYPWLSDFSTGSASVSPTFTASFVGGLNEIRGGLQLLEALDMCRGRVTCVGAGVMSPMISEAAANSSNFNHLGSLPAEDVSSVIQQASVGVVCFLPEPNHIESQPTKLFEYMAAGRPVVCSDFPLWRELLEPFDCAIFVNPEVPREIADALLRVSDYPEEAMEMGRRARKGFEQKFVFDNEAVALVDFYASKVCGKFVSC